MRTPHRSGLFTDPRNRGLRTTIVVSLLLHGGLMAAFGRFHIRPLDRTFYAPMHMIDLVERKPGRSEGQQGTDRATPVPRAPKPTPKPEPKPAAPPKAVQPEPPPPKPVPTRAVPSQLDPKPAPPTRSEKPEILEQRVSQRIARLREQAGETPPPAAGTGEPENATGDERLDQSIASIRKRMGAAAAKPGRPGAVGVRAGGNVLQQVRLRAYYNRLWDHVKENWAVPPGVQGRDLSVIVSILLDRNGRLLRTVLEESSGSEAFDLSALRALERSQPLPPLPEVVSDPTLEVGFRFHGE